MAEAAGLADRALDRGTRFCVFGVLGRDAGHRPVRPGLHRADPGLRRDRDRPRRQLSRAQPQTRALAPGVSRCVGLRRPLLCDRRLRAGPFRRRPAPGQFRHPARGDHELRPEDATQLLLEHVDQPRDPLSRGCLCVGLRVRNPSRSVGPLPRRFLDRIASEADGGRGARAGARARPDVGGRDLGGSGLVCRGAAAVRRADLSAGDLAPELLELQGRPGKSGPAAGPADRRLDRCVEQRRPAFPRAPRRRSGDVRADRSARLLAGAGVRRISRWRVDHDEPRVSGDAAIRPATIHATGPAAQPGHVRADVSRSPTLARCDQRRVSDPEPLRAGGRPARGRVRHVSHA